MRLGTMLLRDAVITLTQLEQALRAQVLTGGRLGTNLVELTTDALHTEGVLARKSGGLLEDGETDTTSDGHLIDFSVFGSFSRAN